MNKEIHGHLNLSVPQDAKKFLRGVRLQGKEITAVHTTSGKALKIEEMTDSQLTFYAKEIYLDFCGGVEGVGGVIELETAGLDQ